MRAPARLLFAALTALPTFAAAQAGPPATLPAAAADRDPVAERFAAAEGELEKDKHTLRAVVDLAKLHALEDGLPELAHLANAYAEVVADRHAPAEVRGLARFYLAGVERARGFATTRTHEHLEQLGFVPGWQIAGPFDNEGKAGFDAVYGPEKELDLSAKYPGKVRDVSWRALPPEARVMGLVNLGDVMRPARDVTAYALAVVDSPRDQKAILWLGASGASKVWVNGQLALSDPGYHPPRLDQMGALVPLAKGANRILVKLCEADGWFGFYARLTTERGDAVRVTPIAVPPLPALARPKDKPQHVETAVEWLDKQVKAARTPDAEARARLDLAIALAEKRPADEQQRRAVEEARKAAELAPGLVDAHLVAARLEDDDNKRRAELEAALAVAPADPDALVALSQHELSRGHPQRAAELARRALAASPRLVSARLALVNAYDLAGLGAEAEQESMAAGRDFPFIPAAVAAAARTARRLDRLDEARADLRKALALRWDDEPSRRTLTQLLVDAGQLDEALRELDVSLKLDPGDVVLRLRKADLLAANGHPERAEAEYAEAERICPDEPDVYEHRGHARLQAGHQKEALADFEKALALKPQNPQLKELVRAVQPESERFEKPYLLDVAELVKHAPAREKDEDAITLGELKVTKVYPSGLASTFSQEVTRVYDQRGADDARYVQIGYTPDRQELRVEVARVIKPDGTVVEAHSESERSTSEPWYQLYYDTRARVLVFPTLAPGDVLEVAYRLDDVASDNLLSDYFGDMTFLQDTQRKAREEYVLLVPAGRKIYENEPKLPHLAHTEKKLEDGEVEHRWSATGVPRIEPEPGMPGWSEVAAYVHVSTYPDWKSVQSFYWGLVREQLVPNDEVKAAAQQIAKAAGTRDELALIKAVYDYVVTNTRYVGLEFGIHGYKPYRVDQILSRRFGDCKDKASLTHALLEALGIDSRLVLLRMRRLGRMPELPASLSMFNHAILYVPKYDLWLDGTAAYSGSRDLPSEDRGATVLVVNPGGQPKFGYIPVAKPEDNETQVRFDVALSADGTAVVKGTSTVTGVQAPGYRRSYAAQNERRAAFEQAWSRTFPGLEVKEVKLSDLDKLEDDVSMRFTLEVPRYAQPDAGGALSFTPFGAGHTYVESYAPLSTRHFDLVVGDPWENHFTYRYTLPAGYAARELPGAVSESSPFGSFTVSYKSEGGALVAEGVVRFSADRVSASDYPAFRTFVAKIDAAMARKVRVSKAVAER